MKPWYEYYPPVDLMKVDRKEYRIEQARMKSLFKADLFEDLGIQNNPRRELLFEKAWDRGHADGYSAVYDVAADLVELIED